MKKKHVLGIILLLIIALGIYTFIPRPIFKGNNITIVEVYKNGSTEVSVDKDDLAKELENTKFSLSLMNTDAFDMNTYDYFISLQVNEEPYYMVVAEDRIIVCSTEAKYVVKTADLSNEILIILNAEGSNN